MPEQSNQTAPLPAVPRYDAAGNVVNQGSVPAGATAADVINATQALLDAHRAFRDANPTLLPGAAPAATTEPKTPSDVGNPPLNPAQQAQLQPRSAAPAATPTSAPAVTTAVPTADDLAAAAKAVADTHASFKAANPVVVAVPPSEVQAEADKAAAAKKQADAAAPTSDTGTLAAK